MTTGEVEQSDESVASIPPWKTHGQQLARFFNTPLGLFVLSSVLLAGVSRVYTDYQAREEQRRTMRVNLAPIVAEMKYRVTSGENFAKDIEGLQRTTERDSCVFLWRMIVGDKEYRPAVPEMREVHWLGLLSRAETLTGIDTGPGERALNQLELNLDGGRCAHPMKPTQQIASLRQLGERIASAYARTAR